jgi:hypothetical protein
MVAIFLFLPPSHYTKNTFLPFSHHTTPRFFSRRDDVNICNKPDRGGKQSLTLTDLLPLR